MARPKSESTKQLISVRVNEPELKYLQKQAVERDVSVAQIVRETIRDVMPSQKE